MRRRQERYDEKLVQILRSAVGIFAEKGYHHASVRDVAAATGVSPAGLYYYFRSKEELLFLILEHALSTLLRQVEEEARRIRDPEPRIAAIIQAHLAFFREHPPEMRVLVRDWDALTGELRGRVVRLQTRYTGLVLRTLKELRPDAPRTARKAATMALFGMVNWMYQWYRPEEDLPLEEMGNQFTWIFLRRFLSEEGQSKGTGSPAGTQGEPLSSASPEKARSLLAGPGF